tara:strand:+ start:75 stop:296 length:222 start_codon:yes stop_codon:yes gene_type:complete
MRIGKDLDLFDGPLEDEYKYDTYTSQLPDADLTEDGMVDMMESLGWDVAKDNILVVPDGDSKIVIRNLNREQD